MTLGRVGSQVSRAIVRLGHVGSQASRAIVRRGHVGSRVNRLSQFCVVFRCQIKKTFIQN